MPPARPMRLAGAFACAVAMSALPASQFQEHDDVLPALLPLVRLLARQAAREALAALDQRAAVSLPHELKEV